MGCVAHVLWRSDPWSHLIKFLLLPLILGAIPLRASAAITSGFPPHRNLLASEGNLDAKNLDQDEFSEFDVPAGAQLILKKKSQCLEGIPMSMLPLAALCCEGTKKVSQCMGVDSKTPGFVGRGCRGENCVTNLVPGPSSCLLEALGVEIDQKDPRLKSTCGIPLEDAYWLKPKLDPAQACFMSIPGVRQEVWVDCSEGKLGKFHVALNFTNTAIEFLEDKSYTCKISMHCSPYPETKLVCYTEDDPMSDSPHGTKYIEAQKSITEKVNSGGSGSFFLCSVLLSFLSAFMALAL